MVFFRVLKKTFHSVLRYKHREISISPVKSCLFIKNKIKFKKSSIRNHQLSLTYIVCKIIKKGFILQKHLKDN